MAKTSVGLMAMTVVPPIPSFFNLRVELRRKAVGALERRLVDAGIPVKGGGRTVEDVLVAGLSPEAETRALEDLAAGGGGELQPAKDGTIAFCSADSSAAIALNTFAPFADHDHLDPVLGMALRSPGFSQQLRITGLKRSSVPNLDVVFRDDDQALLVDSELLEPWHKREDAPLGREYDGPAAAVSPKAVALLEALRSEELTYLTLDAGRLLRQLLGVHNAIARDRLPRQCAIVALHWVPADAGRYGELFGLVSTEVDDFAARLDDQPIAIRGLSYTDLWAGWAADDAPAWLREHAGRLVDRYGVSLRD
jgi:hypothetical protein